MKIIINSTTYSGLKNLSYSPETDVFGNSLPINEFRADIITTDDIAMSQWAELRDDLNALWAKYWIVYAERIDRQTVRIQAQSALRLLEACPGPVPVTVVLASTGKAYRAPDRCGVAEDADLSAVKALLGEKNVVMKR